MESISGLKIYLDTLSKSAILKTLKLPIEQHHDSKKDLKNIENEKQFRVLLKDQVKLAHQEYNTNEGFKTIYEGDGLNICRMKGKSNGVLHSKSTTIVQSPIELFLQFFTEPANLPLVDFNISETYIMTEVSHITKVVYKSFNKIAVSDL
jgi:hypothetical protein